MKLVAIFALWEFLFQGFQHNVCVYCGCDRVNVYD